MQIKKTVGFVTVIVDIPEDGNLAGTDAKIPKEIDAYVRQYLEDATKSQAAILDANLGLALAQQSLLNLKRSSILDKMVG